MCYFPAQFQAYDGKMVTRLKAMRHIKHSIAQIRRYRRAYINWILDSRRIDEYGDPDVIHNYDGLYIESEIDYNDDMKKFYVTVTYGLMLLGKYRMANRVFNSVQLVDE